MSFAVNSLFGVDSHITLFRSPRRTDGGESEIQSMFSNFLITSTLTLWQHRFRLIFRILSFCLGPGSIWRFPQEFLDFQNASYFYIYVLYIFAICLPLLVLEIGLGQYFTKGFTKIYSLSPLMEGIAIAMGLYCVMANFVYSLIAAYSISYMYAAFHEPMPQSHCTEQFKKRGCNETYIFAEKSYFFFYVEEASHLNGTDGYNWRNALYLAFIWTTICLIFIFGLLRRHHWLPIIMTCIIFIVFLFVLIVSVTVEGAGKGITSMFFSKKHSLNSLKTWIYPAEQALISYGIGVGPLTTFWLTSAITHPFEVDCIAVIVLNFLFSLISGMILFSSEGEVSLLKDKELYAFVLLPRVYNSLPKGLGHFTMFCYYLVLFLCCFFSLLEHTHLIRLCFGSYFHTKGRWVGKVVILGLCIFLYVFIANVGVTRVGYEFMVAVNKNFVGSALLIIVSFELIYVSYFYKSAVFCDDIEFMLGNVPNYFYQISWLCLPILFVVFSILSIYLKCRESKSGYDICAICLTLSFTLGPIIGFMSFKCCCNLKREGIRRLINPRWNEREDSLEPPIELRNFNRNT